MPLGEDGSFACPTINNAGSIGINTPVLGPRIIWVRNDNQNDGSIDNYILSQDLSAVTVRNVAVRDEGEHVCRVTDENGAVESETTIINV